MRVYCLLLLTVICLWNVGVQCAEYKMDNGWLNDGDEVYLDLEPGSMEGSDKRFKGFMVKQEERLMRGPYWVDRINVGDTIQLRTYKERGHVLACVNGGKIQRNYDPFDVAADTTVFNIRIDSSGKKFNCVGMYSNKADRYVLARIKLKAIE